MTDMLMKARDGRDRAKLARRGRPDLLTEILRPTIGRSRSLIIWHDSRDRLSESIGSCAIQDLTWIEE
jgi:hypothetical protein